MHRSSVDQCGSSEVLCIQHTSVQTRTFQVLGSSDIASGYYLEQHRFRVYSGVLLI